MPALIPIHMKKTILILLLAIFGMACGGGSGTDQKKAVATVATTDLTFQVSGMHCDMCVASIEKAVGQLAGVDSVRAVLNDSIAFVRFNPDQVNKDEIAKAIESRGYKVKGSL